MRLNHSLNYFDKYLDIKVLLEKTIINYFIDNTLSFNHEYNIGTQKIDEENVSDVVLSDWVNGLLYTLNYISLYDRVPNYIYLNSKKHSLSLTKRVTTAETYSQFYLDDDKGRKNIHVIIKNRDYNNFEENNSNNILINKNYKPYERYKKAISQFKF